MSNAKKYTPAEAQAWVESREWANGWNINTDSTVNAVEFANQYAANKELWDKLFTFLAENDLNTLPAGKHVLVEGKCWVNIMWLAHLSLSPIMILKKTGLSSGPRTRLITCPPNLTTSFFISPGRITSHQ